MLSARNSIQPDMNVVKFSKFLFRDRVFCDKTSSGLKGAVSACSIPVHPKWLLLLRLRKYGNHINMYYICHIRT